MMKIDHEERMLDILFRRIPPERLLRHVREQAAGRDFFAGKEEMRRIFLQFADTTLHGYSEDEQSLLFDRLDQSIQELAEEFGTQCSAFLAPVSFTLEMLTLQGGEPVCRSSQVLRWRNAYHHFGQDLLVCAFLAYYDMKFQIRRDNFAWPAVLRTDDRILRQVLEEGLAENHFHLNGSTQSFSLGWCSLMNNPLSILDLPDKFSSLLQTVASRGPQDNILPLKERLTIAALVRSILFQALHGGEAREDSKTRFNWDYVQSFSPISRAAGQVRVLQEGYGVKIPLPEGEWICLDYALEGPVFQAVKDMPYRALAGERSFLYRCFRACLQNEFTCFEMDLLHLYLSLKTAFRGEMIQVNKQVGFKNFADYQDRKDLAWDSAYRWEACRMALNAPLLSGTVRRLEARLTPSKTEEQLLEKVSLYDRGKRFANQPFQLPLSREESRLDLESHPEEFQREPYFYVLHFPKRNDDALAAPGFFLPQCRHAELRADVRLWAEVLARALSRSPYLCARIRGIDGCSNEVNCRPEVFATAFRFLRHFQSEPPSSSGLLGSKPLHRLSASYHAGEDFYDIADGLRAIDETVNFLEYQRGDRIGHALALGIDPQVHYQTKSMTIILPQQNYLDNLVWMLYRGRELGVCIDPQQYGIMQREALRLLQVIYGRAMEDNHWSVTLQDYYCSMQLRGDDPSLYQAERKFKRPDLLFQSQYDRWMAADTPKSKMLEPYRCSRRIAGMYYYYHFGDAEKREGQKPISVPIRPEYILVVRQTQDALQRYLAARGIIIECNPSSNVLIGTFGEYGRHPITRFNNMGLCSQPDGACPQLHVCVNTDDLGVFDTSLEFEYALLYRALSEQADEEGRPVYNGKRILRYIQNLREMGMQAVFPGVREDQGG